MTITEISECASKILPGMGILFGGLGYFLHRRADERKTFLELLDLYYTREVHRGSRQLWQLYRDSRSDTEAFLNAYLERRDKDNGDLDELRRQVTHFWRRLGAILQHKLISPKIVYQWWPQDSVEIVDKILVILENGIARKHGATLLNPDTDPLYYLLKVKHEFYKTP